MRGLLADLKPPLEPAASGLANSRRKSQIGASTRTARATATWAGVRAIFVAVAHANPRRLARDDRLTPALRRSSPSRAERERGTNRRHGSRIAGARLRRLRFFMLTGERPELFPIAPTASAWRENDGKRQMIR